MVKNAMPVNKLKYQNLKTKYLAYFLIFWILKNKYMSNSSR